MRFHVMTLFPEMIENGLGTSIIGRAAKAGHISYEAVNIRDFTQDKHGKVDDYPYGGGAGMLIQAQPVYDAYRSVTAGMTGKPRTIYLTPQGRRFDQKMAAELAGEEDLVFLCGHYEGVDERVLEEIVTDYVSIGDYVLTGGELPVMVMIDAIARLVPGVLNNDVSAETETFHNDLLEYPQYTRPEIWHDKKVPEILLSGNHKNIVGWRLEQSVQRTKKNRPDLYAKYQKRQQVIKRLSKKKRLNIHMMEFLNRGLGEIAYEEGLNLILTGQGIHELTAESEEAAKRMLQTYGNNINECVVNQEFLKDLLEREYGMKVYGSFYQACYTLKEAMPVKHKDIRRLDMSVLDYVTAHYANESEEYLAGRISAGMMYGAYVEDCLVGFVGIHSDGSCGMLYVDEAYRGRSIGMSLEAFIINTVKNNGYVPFGHVSAENTASLQMQEKLGLYLSETPIWWLRKK